MRNLFITTCIVIGLSAPVLAEGSQDEDMRALTSSVLAGLTGAAPAADEPVAEADQASLGDLIQQAVQAGQSDAYLEALVNEAVQQGSVEVPDAMVDTEGTVDTATLLASLVSKSSGTPDVATLDSEAGASADAPAAEDQFYVVQSGDSLARISLSFYDTTQDYLRIFDANRDQLSSPDRIRVGQKLLIPG